MKRPILPALLLAGIFGSAWAAHSFLGPSEAELSRFVPPGALLYLEAKDFSSLLSDWNDSEEKRNWVASKNFDAFSQSRLLLRLEAAGGEFSSAAGVPANADLLHQVAGKQSALAVYDIGKVQFLYVTRLPSADSMQSALWQTRSQFESRSAGGVNFFYRKDPGSDREVAFAVTGGYLLLATREDLMAGALELLAGSKNRSVADESWWSRPVAAAGEPGDLRMVLNLDEIVPSPYFRSYWIQQNVTHMKQYSTAISDLVRSGKEYHEERSLFRRDAIQDPSGGKGGTAVAEILRLVPADVGLYEASANPDPKASLELLVANILSPHLAPPAQEKIAPQVQLGSAETGSVGDLETRIDQPPAQNSLAGDTRASLQAVFQKNRILAQLQIKKTDRDAAGVFIRVHSAVAFLGESDWDQESVQSALVEFARPGFTAGQLGLEWRNGSGYGVLDGLWPLAVSAHGKYLIVSDSATLLSNMLQGLTKKTTAPAAAFAAGFDHQGERDDLVALTRLLDAGAESDRSPGSPEFFSENIASLSFVLRNVSSEKIVICDVGNRQTQTVTYAWAQ